ncbi:MAG TPA: oligosaccharide flippase family protein [Solirubrobacteraceae bacterium]|nr:oligosaccharide flippase family protein [Solirubrobacteraceae bacterium]
MADRDDVGRETRAGIVWSTASFVGTKALTFVSTVALARLLAPSDFGVVAAILVVVGVLELLSDLGMRSVVVYEQEEGVTPRVQTAYTVNLLIAAALTGVAVLTAPLTAAFFGMEEHTWLFRLAALSLLLTGLGNIHDSLLLRSLRFRRRAVPEIARTSVRAGVSVALAIAGLGAEAMIYGVLAGGAAWVLSLWTLSPFRPTLRLDPAILRSMAGYGGAAALLELLGIVGSRADIFVIGRMLGERVLGVYSVATRIPELIIENVAWNVSVVAFPALSRQRTIDSGGMAALTLGLLRWQAVYALPVGVGLAVLAEPIMVVLFGEVWREGAGVLAAIAIMSAIGAVTFPIGDVFKALGQQRRLVAINLVAIPLFVAAIIVAAPAGIVLVAWVRAITRSLFGAVVVADAARIAGIRWRAVVGALGPGLGAALGVAAGAGAVRLAMPEAELVPLLAGTLAGGAGGIAGLRLLAPVAFGELRRLVTRREAPAPAGVS